MPVIMNSTYRIGSFGTTSLNVSTFADNDLMLLFGVTVGATVQSPVSAGWTDIFGVQYSGSTGSGLIRFRGWWKYKTAGETTVTVPNLYNVSSGGGYSLNALSGVDQTTPFDITPTTAQLTNGGNGSSINPAAVTPVTPGSMVVTTAYNWSSSGTSSHSFAAPFSQFPMVTYLNTGTTNKVYQRIGYLSWTSGVVDAAISSNFEETWLTATVVIRADPLYRSGRVSVWNGTAWVDKPAKVWNGTAWVTKPVKTWDGSSWITTA